MSEPELTIVRWADATGTDLAPQYSGGPPAPRPYRDTARRLLDTDVPLPPAQLPTTLPHPVWTLRHVTVGEAGGRWCFTVQGRGGPYGRGGTCWFAFAPDRFPPAQVWRAAMRQPVVDAGIVPDPDPAAIAAVLAALTLGRARVLVPGQPDEVGAVLGRVLTALPAPVVASRVWATCLLQVADGRPAVTGDLPAEFRSQAPDLAREFARIDWIPPPDRRDLARELGEERLAAFDRLCEHASTGTDRTVADLVRAEPARTLPGLLTTLAGAIPEDLADLGAVDPTLADLIPTDPAPTDDAALDAALIDAAVPEPARIELVLTDAALTDAALTDAGRTDAARTDAARIKSLVAEPEATGPSKADTPATAGSSTTTGRPVDGPASDSELGRLLGDPAGQRQLADQPHLLHGWAARNTQDALDHLQFHPDSPARTDLFAGLFTVQQHTDANLLGLPIAGLPRSDWADRLAGLFIEHQPDPVWRADVFRQFTRPGGVLQRPTDLTALHDWLAGPVGLDPNSAPDLFPPRVNLIADDLGTQPALTPRALGELQRAPDPFAALAAAVCQSDPVNSTTAAEILAAAVGLDPDRPDRTTELGRALTAHCAPAKGKQDVRWLAALLAGLESRGLPLAQRRAVLYGGLIELTRRPGASPLDDDRLRARCLALGLDEQAPASVRELVAAIPARKRARVRPSARLDGVTEPDPERAGARWRLSLRVGIVVTLIVAGVVGYWLAPHTASHNRPAPQRVSQATGSPGPAAAPGAREPGPAASPAPVQPAPNQPGQNQPGQNQPAQPPVTFTVRYESRLDDDAALAEFRRQLGDRVARRVVVLAYSATAETARARATELRTFLLGQTLPGLTTASIVADGQPAADSGQRGTVQFQILFS